MYANARPIRLTGDRAYDAFGNKSSYRPTADTFGWNAKSQYQTDGSGLMLLGNRYYDCSVGRFISQDPAQDESNWYSYCGNNPLVTVDPSGLVRVKVDGRWFDIHADDKDVNKGPGGEHGDPVGKGERGTSGKDYLTPDGKIHNPSGEKIGEGSKAEKEKVKEAFGRARRIREEAGMAPVPEGNREGAKDPNAKMRTNVGRAGLEPVMHFVAS